MLKISAFLPQFEKVPSAYPTALEFNTWATGVLQSPPPSFLEPIKNSAAQVKEAQEFYRRTQHHDALVVIGMGGSSLGGQCLCAFNEFSCDETLSLNTFAKTTRPVLFINRTNPYWIQKKLQYLSGFKNPHFLFISKSGTTTETLSLANFLFPQLTSNNCSVISSPSTPLYSWAKKNNFHFFPYITALGGRYSVFSNVGLFPASFTGFPLAPLFGGAQSLLENLNSNSLLQLFDSLWRIISGSTKALYLWSFSPQLNSFSFWFQQLFAESLGKPLQEQGSAACIPAPIPLIDTLHQHSVYQQIMEGSLEQAVFLLRATPSEKFEPQFPSTVPENSTQKNYSYQNHFPELPWINENINSLYSRQIQSLSQALKENESPLVDICLEATSPQELGELLLACEICMALLGKSLGINPYDQPGVEASKRLFQQSL